MSEIRTTEQFRDSVTVEPQTGGALKGFSAFLIVLGVIFTAVLLGTSRGRADFGYAWLIGFGFVWAIALGALWYVALHHLIGAVWSVVIRRVAEFLAQSLWLVGVLFVPVLLIFFLARGDAQPFHWRIAEGDALIDAKGAYLNEIFFLIPPAVFFLGWILFARWYVGRSIGQDIGATDHGQTHRFRALAGPFMVLFGFSVSFAAFDWLMSLDAHWFSTIYGVYVFAGIALTSLATITLLVIWLNKRGRLGEDIVTPQHLYSLGCLLFTFTCFWAYIWFSQFMLIWYGNINEETIWFAHRGWGEIAGHEAHKEWLTFTVTLLVLRFILPFAMLLSRWSKMTPRMLALVSILILVGQFWDLCWLVLPQASGHEHAPNMSVGLVGPCLLMIGVVGYGIGQQMQKHRCVPVGDPLFEASCRFQLTI